MTTLYQPEVGDLVDVGCDVGCPHQFNFHGGMPTLQGLRGIVQNTEMPSTEDHLYMVRFFGPEWAHVEVRRGLGVRMYFKRNELTLVRR